MPRRTKRGLGLLLLGLPTWGIGLALAQWRYPDGVMEWIAPIATLLVLLAGLVSAVVGFVMIVWGLLRD